MRGVASQDLERFCNQKCERCTAPVRSSPDLEVLLNFIGDSDI